MERFGYGIPGESVQKTTEHGQHISASKNPVTLGPSGDVAKHEALHVVASGGDIVSSTIVPEGNALGTTVPRKLTSAGAAAAAAFGHDGTSWDEFITEFYLGVSFGTAKAAARVELWGKDLEVQAVAGELQRKRTISQRDVTEAYEKADKVRRGVSEVIIIVFDLSGRKKEYREETDKDLETIIVEFERDEEKVHQGKNQKDLMPAA